MILAIAVTIFCIVSPTDTAKADTEPTTTTTAVTNTTELSTEGPKETNQPKQMKIKAKDQNKDYITDGSQILCLQLRPLMYIVIQKLQRK